MINRFRYWLALKILGDLGLITNVDFYSAILPKQQCLVVNCTFTGKFKEDDFDYSAFYEALSRKSTYDPKIAAEDFGVVMLELEKVFRECEPSFMALRSLRERL